MVLGHGLIIQPVLLACTYDNDTIIALKKKIDIVDFPSKFIHEEVDSTSKHNWHGIKIEIVKHYKLTKDRLKWKACPESTWLFVEKTNQCPTEPQQTTQILTKSHVINKPANQQIKQTSNNNKEALTKPTTKTVEKIN